MIRFFRPLCALALLTSITLVLVGGCATAERPVQVRVGQTADIPSTLCNGYFFVEANFEGHDFTLILDTGAEQTVLDTVSAFQAFPNRVTPTLLQAVSADGTRTTIDGTVRVRNVRLGPVDTGQVNALVLNLQPISDVLGTRIDGLIGWDVLKHLAVEMDYAGARVRVGPTGSLPISGGQKLSSGPLPVVSVDMPDGTRRFSIDTGSSGSFEMPTLDRVPLIDLPRVTGVARSITGDTTTIGGRMDGTIRFAGTTYRYPLLETSQGQARIGAGAFKTGTLYLDGPASTIAFRSRLGETFVQRGERRLPIRINREVPWTIAGGLDQSWLPRLGLEVGDEITAINGVDVEVFGCKSIAEIAGGANEVTLTLLSNGSVREVRAPLIEMTPPAP
ncbi:MAG: aspartyl protease family protein [Planctomycetota bacterium]